jgi:hypothetical protein
MLNALALLVVFYIATGPFIVARGNPGVASVIPGYDIVIINGRIIDGSGNPRFYGRNMLRASEEAPRRLLDGATPSGPMRTRDIIAAPGRIAELASRATSETSA